MTSTWKTPINLGKGMPVLTDCSDVFQTSLALKIRFPSALTKGYWAIEEQTQKTTFAIPFLAVLMVVYCAQPVSKRGLFLSLSSLVQNDESDLEKTFSDLVKRKIIHPKNQQERMLKDVEHWKSTGWAAAADYHFFTWDIQFLDYTKEGKGHEIDRNKMANYQKEQADTFRCKTYPQKKTEIPLPSVRDLLDCDIGELSTEERLKHLLACIFGKIGEKPCHWTDIPLLRRTSPSGGCRHPCEGYFLPSRELNIESGFFHIQTDPVALSLLTEEYDEVSQLIVQEGIECSDYLGTIIISTVFERNMYRYREPRTFRTIHMDAGHIIASIETLSEELGFKAIPQLKFNENGILNVIGASELEEGVIATVALKRGDSPR